MSKIRREDLDFDFDIKKERNPIVSPSKVEYVIEPRNVQVERVRLGSLTLTLGEDCLILRRRARHLKEKTLVSLDEIESTKVQKVTFGIFIFLAIFFLICGLVSVYPLYKFLETPLFAIIAGSAGLAFFFLFLVLFLTTRKLRVIINFSRTRNIKYTIYDTKQFENLNNFFDEVYKAKHKLFK